MDRGMEEPAASCEAPAQQQASPALKTCNKCKLVRSIEEFYKSNNGKQPWCKKCDNYRTTLHRRQKSIAEGRRQKISTLEARAMNVNGLKRCPRCRETKSVSEFSKFRDGYSPHCKVCCHEMRKPYDRQAYEHRKAAQREAKLKRDFGITMADYSRMLNEQNGACYICKGVDKNKVLAVDHDHSTGKVRSLLCGRCNPAVGFVGTPEIAESIAAYLRKHA